MTEKIIELRQDEPYITLGILLKVAKVISTGGEAKFFLNENEVLVNREKENRRGRKLYPNDKVEVANNVFLVKDHGYN